MMQKEREEALKGLTSGTNINIKNEELVKNTENLIKEDSVERAKTAKKLSQQQEIISEGISNISRRFGGKARERIIMELK